MPARLRRALQWGSKTLRWGRGAAGADAGGAVAGGGPASAATMPRLPVLEGRNPADVLLIKEFLRQHIGTTYVTATMPSDANLLGVDMTDWGGLRRARACAPFNQLRAAQGGYREYVRRQLAKLCPWHHWA